MLQGEASLKNENYEGKSFDILINFSTGNAESRHNTNLNNRNVNVISEGFKFYKNFFYSYTIKTFPVFLLIGISTSAGETFLNDERFFTWGALFFIFTNMFLNPFIAVLSVLLVNDLISDSLKETIGYYLVSLQIFFKLFILSLALSLITLLGLFLFIIPGVYLASRLILAPFFLIIENFFYH